MMTLLCPEIGKHLTALGHTLTSLTGEEEEDDISENVSTLSDESVEVADLNNPSFSDTVNIFSWEPAL